MLTKFDNRIMMLVYRTDKFEIKQIKKGMVVNMSNAEMKMLEKLEELRKDSEKGTYGSNRVYAMSDGHSILGAETTWHVDFLKEIGYWVCSIFENGHRVEA